MNNCKLWFLIPNGGRGAGYIFWNSKKFRPVNTIIFQLYFSQNFRRFLTKLLRFSNITRFGKDPNMETQPKHILMIGGRSWLWQEDPRNAQTARTSISNELHSRCMLQTRPVTMPAISIMLSAFIPAKTVFPLSIDEIDHNSQELSKLPLRANLGPNYQASISAETN